jgi:hypothetical protein
MVHDRTTNFRKLAAQSVRGRIAPASVTVAWTWHRPRVDRLRLFATAFAYLIVFVLFALVGGFIASALPGAIFIAELGGEND